MKIKLKKILSKISFLALTILFVVSTMILIQLGLVLIIKLLKLNISHMIAKLILTVVNNLCLIFCLIFLPKKFPKKLFEQLEIKKKDFAFSGWLKWSHIGLALAGIVVYVLIDVFLLSLAVKFLPWFNPTQKQELGFELGSFLTRWQMMIGFLAIVIFVPITEELIFRGYLFGQINKKFSKIITIIIVRILFGIAHGAWNVGIDPFSLSVSMCIVRILSDSIYPSILMHMAKNCLAFLVLTSIIGL